MIIYTLRRGIYTQFGSKIYFRLTFYVLGLLILNVLTCWTISHHEIKAPLPPPPKKILFMDNINYSKEKMKNNYISLPSTDGENRTFHHGETGVICCLEYQLETSICEYTILQKLHELYSNIFFIINWTYFNESYLNMRHIPCLATFAD